VRIGLGVRGEGGPIRSGHHRAASNENQHYREEIFPEFFRLEYAAAMAPRGRKLDEERSEHILGTVLDVLHDVGYDQLRMQDVAERAGVGLSTIYRRWPTKQDLVRASLECPKATEQFVTTGDPRADLHAFLRRMAEDLTGEGAQGMLGFLASLRADPEVAAVFRETKLARMQEHLRSLLAAELGEDFPDLDLRAAAGPAILVYQAAVCGEKMDPEAMATRLTELLFAPLPAGLTTATST
jgi:AcrR family transcriptional regulator